MDLNEFVKLFAEQFMNPSETDFNPETRFHELSGWTSMTALLEIAMIEDHFGTTIPSENLRNAETIRELYDVIQKVKANG